MELESVRVQLEEESEARLDIERQLVKANGEVTVWRSKYETEANARAEEVINFFLLLNIDKLVNKLVNCPIASVLIFLIFLL